MRVLRVYMNFEIFPEVERPVNFANSQYRDMKEMVKLKYESFDKEIEDAIEENQQPVVLISMEPEGIALEYGDIPPHLEQKMMDAITYKDWADLYRKWIDEGLDIDY